jgi:hypothetical protein
MKAALKLVLHNNNVANFPNRSCFPGLLEFFVLVSRRRVLWLKEPGGVLPAGEAARHRAEEGVFESFSEVPVKVGVNHRIQGRVEVTNPEQHAY